MTLESRERLPAESEAVQPTAYAFDTFRLDVACRQFLREGEVVPLAPRVFDLLVYLIKARHRVVEKEELFRAVWNDAHVTDDSLVQAISTLRRALADGAATPRYIQTIPKKGYRFVGDVTHAEAPVAEAAAATLRPHVTPEASSDDGHARPVVRRVTEAKVYWTGALAAIAAAGLIGWSVGRSPDEPAPSPVFLSQSAPFATTARSGGVVSPDGSRLVMAVQGEGSDRSLLWVRSLVTPPSERPIEGTEEGWGAFWSPDGSAIGFFADGKLKIVSLDGGPPRILASLGPYPSGGSWSSQNLIVFADRLSGLTAVSAAGGDLAALSPGPTEEGEKEHRWPSFLPDGRRFLYAIDDKDGTPRTFVGDLETMARKEVLEGVDGAIYSPTGHLLFVRDQTLFAQEFDVASLVTIGRPIQIASEVSALRSTTGATLSVSGTGLLAFGGGPPQEHLLWVDRTGRPTGTSHAQAGFHDPVVIDEWRFVAGGGDQRPGLWLVDDQRGTSTRLTTQGRMPVIAPDASRIAYVAGRSEGLFGVYLTSVGGGLPEAVVRTDRVNLTNDWTRDGKYVVYSATTTNNRHDIWLLPLTGEPTPQPYVETPFDEMQAQVSPNGKWIAYASDESGTWEVYVDSFPKPGAKHIVSTDGGAQPQWRRDGRELFYRSTNRSVMAVGVHDSGASIVLDTPIALFHTPTAHQLNRRRNEFAVSPDGQRFLIDGAYGVPEQRPTTIVVGFDTLVSH